MSDGVELLVFNGAGEAVKHLVDLGPALQTLHVVDPAPDVWIGGKIAADDLAQRQQGDAEVIGDGDRITAEVWLVRPEPVVVENSEPDLRAFLAPGNGCVMRFGARSLVVRKNLRVDKPVCVVAVEVGVEPIHHLVDLGALFQVLRVRGQVELVGQVFEDGRAFRKPEVAVV